MESDFAERLCMHDWPFNVRELVLLAKRLVTLHGSDVTLRAQHLPERIAGRRGAGARPRRRRPSCGQVIRRRSAAGPRAPAEPVELPALRRRAARLGRQRGACRRHAGDQPPARLPPDGGAGGRSGGARASRRSGDE